MLKNKVAKQPARSIPPSLALLWRCLLAQIHSFPLFSQVQWYQQLFLLLAQGSNSAAGHLCQTAPFLCRLCIPASSRKSAGNVTFNPRPPATQGLFSLKDSCPPILSHYELVFMRWQLILLAPLQKVEGLQVVFGHRGSLMVEEKWEESKLLVSKRGTKTAMQNLSVEAAEVPKCSECSSAGRSFPKFCTTVLKRWNRPKP